MIKINITEEAYNKLKERLVKESTFGNDDLENLYEELKMAFNDFNSVVGEHLIMTRNMGEEPNEYVAEIKEHCNAIGNILEELGRNA